jgi:hypothetical protein
VITEPLPADAPDTPVCVTVHENVVPLTLLVNTQFVAVPEQIVALAGVALTFGAGFTVITIGGIVDVQPADVVAVTL